MEVIHGTNEQGRVIRYNALQAQQRWVANYPVLHSFNPKKTGKRSRRTDTKPTDQRVLYGGPIEHLFDHAVDRTVMILAVFLAQPVRDHGTNGANAVPQHAA